MDSFYSILQSIFDWGKLNPANTLTLAVTISAAFTGFWTWRNAALLRRMIESSNRPHLEVRVRNTAAPSTLSLIVINHGNTPATILNFRLKSIYNAGEFSRKYGLKQDKDENIGSERFHIVDSFKDHNVIFPPRDKEEVVAYEFHIPANDKEAHLLKPVLTHIIKIKYKGIGRRRYHYTSVHEQGQDDTISFYRTLWSSYDRFARYSHRKLKENAEARKPKQVTDRATPRSPEADPN